MLDLQRKIESKLYDIYFVNFVELKTIKIILKAEIKVDHWKLTKKLPEESKVVALRFVYICEFRMDIEGQFKLRRRSAPVEDFRGMEQYDWLWNGFFTGQGFHYGQDFSSGELQAWKKRQHGYQHGDAFC